MAISRFDQAVTPAMFLVTLAFLASVGIAAELLHQGVSEEHVWEVLRVALGLWPLYWVEAAVRLWLRWRAKCLTVRAVFRELAVAVCPPLRLGARDALTGQYIWVPLLGWQRVSKDLYYRVERALSFPMMLIALAILPVLAVELGLPRVVEAYWQVRYVLILSTAVIWMAFVIEFVLLFSLAENKLAYVKEHWLDLLIVLLPLVAFLRLTRLARLGRVARYLRTEKLGRLLRTYSMRALRTKLFRAILLLNLLDRVLRRNPKQRLERLRQELERKEREVAELRRRIRELEEQIRASAEEEATVSERVVSGGIESG